MTSFITPTSLNNSRSDFSGWLGLAFQVGAASIDVSDVGRWVKAGNSAAHTVRIYSDNGSGVGTLLGSASVITSGQPTAAFSYTTLGSVITLTANGKYIIASQETSGGDTWWDELNMTMTTTGDATAQAPVYSADGTNFTYGYSYGTAARTYIPIDFLYTLTATGGKPHHYYAQMRRQAV